MGKVSIYPENATQNGELKMFSQNVQEVLAPSLITDSNSKIKYQDDTDELKNALNRILTRTSGINKMIGTLILI